MSNISEYESVIELFEGAIARQKHIIESAQNVISRYEQAIKDTQAQINEATNKMKVVNG